MLEENDIAEGTQQQSIDEELTNNQSESHIEDEKEETPEVETDELSLLKNELNEQKDKYLRLFAEFDNFKKRSAKERLELFKIAGQDVIRELLPVLDDFQRADKAYNNDGNPENYVNGVKLVYEKMQKTLQLKGLKPIESIGKPFNVEFHEAIAEVPAEKASQKGIIVDEVENGYTLNDAIIRYAKVVVAK
jgi:molecular chaperone GrpE